MQTIGGVGGKSGHRIEFSLLARGEEPPPRTPFLGGGETGFSPIEAIIRTYPLDLAQVVGSAVNRIREHNEGAFVGFVSPEVASRPLCFIQSNRGPFYEGDLAPQGVPRQAWRDFYYATSWVAIETICREWKSDSIEISHLSGHSWLPGIMECLLEALGHHLDEGTLSLRAVYFNSCSLNGPETILDAMKVLGHEQRGDSPPAQRTVRQEAASLRDFKLPEMKGISIRKVLLK